MKLCKEVMALKYEAINELANFDYHDALINKIDFQGQGERMIWEVSNINALTWNSQNPFDENMCIGDAVMIFEDAYIESIVYGGYTVYDENNIVIESEEPKTALPEEYYDILKSVVTIREGNSFIESTEIFDLDLFTVLDDGRYKARFDTKFFITIIFSKSIIKWDDFSGKAWYARDEWKAQVKEHEKS